MASTVVEETSARVFSGDEWTAARGGAAVRDV
jgi:hypothetical protein